MTYIDGFVVPVSPAKRQAYIEAAKTAWAVFRENGAIRQVEAWGDEVPEGKVTDFRRAVQAGEGEVVVFSWIEWPSKEAHDRGMKAAMADPRLNLRDEMPFDGKRMIFGGFTAIVDER